MTNRYMLNEVIVPVSLDLLALLLRSEPSRVSEIVQHLPAAERASLAAFCFSRCHMRSLGIQIASRCDERSLRLAAGALAELLIEQSRSPTAFDAEPYSHSRKKVTLARFAA